MPSPIRTTTRRKNIDCMIKMRGSRTNSMSDEEPMASKKPNCKKNTTSKTKPSTINMPSPKKTAVNSLTEITINQSASKKTLFPPSIPPNPLTYQMWMYPRKRNRRKMPLFQRWALVATQSARRIWMKILMIVMSLILRLWRLMSQLMYATGHKQLYASFLNYNHWNVSKLIANFLYITSVNLPGSKRKDIQIPLHVTAAFTTHSTNTNMSLIGLGFWRSPCLATKVRNCQLIWMQPLPSRLSMLVIPFLMEKTTSSEMCQHQPLPVRKTQLSVISTRVGRI